MKTKSSYFFSFLLLAMLVVPFHVEAKKVKNIIFIIGDGMGLNQMYAAMTSNGNSLNIEQCQYVGLVKTYSFDDYITDSAAGGTALACGVKTRNGMIGMNPDSSKIESILHIASKNGLSTGLVVSSSVTHATPASFVAHQISRKLDKAIAADYLNTDIDVFIGGGRKFFKKSIDNRNLLIELKEKGYHVVENQEEMMQVESGKLAALLDQEHPGRVQQRGALLLNGTQKAIDLLSDNKKGFFLMIEGSQIDWAGHENNPDYLLEEMMDLDKTIGYVIDFAKKNGETLVVITADHETGGMIIEQGDFEQKNVSLIYTTKEHTGTLVPVYSFGRGAEFFTGIFENIDFKSKFLNLYGFKR